MGGAILCLALLFSLEVPQTGGLETRPLENAFGVKVVNPRVRSLEAVPVVHRAPAAGKVASLEAGLEGSGTELSFLLHTELIGPLGRVVFKYSPTSGLWTKVTGGPSLCAKARETIPAMPEKARELVAMKLSKLTYERQRDLLGAFDGLEDQRFADEIAWLIALSSPEDLASEFVSGDYLLRSVRSIYRVAEKSSWASLVESKKGDETSITYRYEESGEVREWTMASEDYYSLVVHPKLDGEAIGDLSPATGKPATPPDGRDFRSYFLNGAEQHDPYTRHYIFSDLDGNAAFDPSTLSGMNPSSLGWLSNPVIDPLVLTGNHLGQATTVEFRVDRGTVLATTLLLEQAALQKSSPALTRFGAYGPGNINLKKDSEVLVLHSLGADAMLLEQLVPKLPYKFTLMNPADFATADLSPYKKIIVFGWQQNDALLAAAARKADLETWLKSGWTVLELHCGLTARAGLEELELPGGLILHEPEAASDRVFSGGQPPLDMIIEAAPAVIWDSEKYPGLSGDRPFNPEGFVLDQLGWWVSQNLFDNVSEWSEKHNRNAERSPYAQRIVFNHFGNCGELQDMLIAGGRTLLLPISGVSNSNEDHVWNEFLLEDSWYPLQVSWSDGPTHVNEPSVSGDDLWGGGKNLSMVSKAGTDGRVFDVTEHYSDTCDIEIQVQDNDGNPVEGALVMVASEAFYEQAGLIIGLWGLSDADGWYRAKVGPKNNYYIRVQGASGGIPEEDNTVGLLVEADKTETGGVYSLAVKLPYSMPKEKVAAVPPEAPAPAGETDLRVTASHLERQRCGTSVYRGETFCEAAGAGSLELYVLDPTEYQGFIDGAEFAPLAHFTLAEDKDAVLPEPAEGELYFVLLNRSGLETRVFSELRFALVSESGQDSSDAVSPGQGDVSGAADLAEFDQTGGEAAASGGGSGGCNAGSGSAAGCWSGLLFGLVVLLSRRRPERVRRP